MKGVVLAGGRGTRLRPITRVVNKHVLPVYDEPVIHYPVRTLLDAGIEEILVVSNADHIGKYMELLEMEFDANFSYAVQSEPKGIAHGLGLAEEFADGEPVALILGDNLLLGDLSQAIRSFEVDPAGARVFVTPVEEPSAYGIATIENDRVVKLQEKPDSADSNRAVIGLYLYENDVFDRIDELTPSDRGEYEITDLNRLYMRDGSLAYSEFDGEWFDVGTPEGLFEASQCVRRQVLEGALDAERTADATSD